MIDPKTRRDTLGASEWAAVLGISPFGDAFKVYQRKTGQADGSFTSARMADGNDTENFVLNLAEKRLPLVAGTKIVGQQVQITHHSERWATATLDALCDVVIDGRTVSAVVEAKTISTKLYIQIPEYYLIQVLVQMWCCGLEDGYLVVWSTRDTQFGTWHIKFADHKTWFNECLTKVKSFWHENVVKRVPPEHHVIEREKTTDVPEDLMEQYLDAQDAERLAKEQKDLAKQKILEHIGERTEDYRVKTGDYQIDITYVVTKRLDTDKLKAEQGENLAPFYTESKSQRFTLKRVSLKPFSDSKNLAS